LGFFGQLRGVFFFQNAGESINVAEGSAEIVRDGIAEGFEFLIHGGEIGVGTGQFSPMAFHFLLGFLPVSGIRNNSHHSHRFPILVAIDASLSEGQWME
jgi:hypothetical protein